MKRMCLLVILVIFATAASSAEVMQVTTRYVCGIGYVKSMRLDRVSKDERLRLYVAMDTTGFGDSVLRGGGLNEIGFVHPIEQREEDHWELLVKMLQGAMLARSPVRIVSDTSRGDYCVDVGNKEAKVKVCTDHESCNDP